METRSRIRRGESCEILPQPARPWPFVRIAAVVLALSDPAAAADGPPAMPLKAPKIPPFDWTGFYLGSHVGYGRGNARITLSDPNPTPSNNRFGSLYGGLQLGYNYLLPSNILLGVESDVSFPNSLANDDNIAWRPTRQTVITEQLDYMATLRGRVGYVANNWLVYVSGGLAWAQGRFTQVPGTIDTDTGDKILRLHTGFALGAGVERAIAPDWTARLEYLYRRFGEAGVVFPSGNGYASSWDVHTVRLALNRKLSWPGADPTASKSEPSSALDPGSFEVHGQTTYIQQGYPGFRSPYVGPNSLTPWAQTRETWTISGFLGARLWDGGELYYNPELLQGFGLHDTSGAGGYPNGEAQKSNFAYPHYNTSRLFLRQAFGFGGEQETLDSEPNQLSGKVDVSRLTVQVGKFAVPDVFDDNAYAKDTRRDFMNWSIWASGAFDYSADKVGLTYGAVAEFNQKNWALRGGYFLMDAESNANNFDVHLFSRGQYVVELEQRYSLFSQPGKLRTIAWLNSVFAGSYREALDEPGLALDITQTRRGRLKYGYVVNLEQSVTDEIGLFGRWSWNDGRNEIMAFADIDASLSFGTSIKGAAWGRPNDTIGLGAAVNGLSRDHRDFLAAGGITVLVGDGQLNYRTEKVLETYYALAAWSNTILTFDYQLIADPAYNADRGPISIFSARLHAEF
jgi:high affinity Mn2+ porin